MATDPNPSPSTSLVERVKNILIQPAAEWPRIEAEPASVGGIYRNYVLILAAIPPVAMAIGFMLLSYGLFGTSYVLVFALIHYLLSLVSVYVLALLVDALAPTFDGTKDPVKAFKLVAYAFTAAWVAGIAFIIPMLGFLIGLIGGLYSLYLLYLGLPVMMKVSAERAVPYLAVTIVASAIVWWLVFKIATAIALNAIGLSGPGLLAG